MGTELDRTTHFLYALVITK